MRLLRWVLCVLACALPAQAEVTVLGGGGSSSGSTLSGATPTLSRTDFGSITLTTQDNSMDTAYRDNTAELFINPGGFTELAIPDPLDRFTITTPTTYYSNLVEFWGDVSFLGNSKVTLPKSAVSGDSLGALLYDSAVFCGALPNASVTFASPITGFPAGAGLQSGNYQQGGTSCAVDTTQATADLVMYPTLAMRAHALYCKTSAAATKGASFRVNASAGTLDNDLVCHIKPGASECKTSLVPFGTIPANAPVSIRVSDTEDLSLQTFWCSLSFSL